MVIERTPSQGLEGILLETTSRPPRNRDLQADAGTAQGPCQREPEEDVAPHLGHRDEHVDHERRCGPENWCKETDEESFAARIRPKSHGCVAV